MVVFLRPFPDRHRFRSLPRLFVGDIPVFLVARLRLDIASVYLSLPLLAMQSVPDLDRTVFPYVYFIGLTSIAVSSWICGSTVKVSCLEFSRRGGLVCETGLSNETIGDWTAAQSMDRGEFGLS